MANGDWENIMRLPVAIVITGQDGQVLSLNEAFSQLVGYSAAELESMQLADIIHPADLEQDRESSRQLLHRDIPAFTAEMRYRRRDGRCIAVAVSTTDLRPKGKLPRTIRIVQDISERSRLKAALATTDDNFRALCEASMDGVLIHDEGAVVMVNQALADMFGYDDPAEVGKLAPDALFATTSRSLVLQHFQTGNGYALDTIGLRKNGSTFPIRMRVKGIKYEMRRVRLSTIQPGVPAVNGNGSDTNGTGSRARPPLSPRELEVFRMLVKGTDNLVISKRLNISRRTVEHHVSHILTKLGAANRTAAVLVAYHSGLLAELEGDDA